MQTDPSEFGVLRRQRSECGRSKQLKLVEKNIKEERAAQERIPEAFRGVALCIQLNFNLFLYGEELPKTKERIIKKIKQK